VPVRGLSVVWNYVRRHHVGLLALVIALGGTAYAATKLPPKSVGPKQIKAGAVTAKKIRAGAVGSEAVLDNSLGGADIEESTLQGVNATTLGGQALADLGSTAASTPSTDCDDNSHGATGTQCGSTSIQLKEAGRLLILLRGDLEAFQLNDPSGPGSGTDEATSVIGSCAVRVDNQGLVAGSGAVVSDEEDHTPLFGLEVTDSLDPGAHTISVTCLEFDGSIFFNGMSATAVTLAAD
jgi:hypothetical protein